VTTETNHRPLIVVGVDGSEGSEKALRWAENYAELSHGTLRIVYIWRYPAAYGFEIADPDFHPDELARTTLEEATSDVKLPADRVVRSLGEGSAAEGLLEESRNADLLVVGSHGRGAFKGMLLGSVSTHLVHHAHCPVTVVH
jgi:nucleotide-binding universal stress UspA family protein